ncbi:MAG TPA: ABC transporter permease [Lentimicrobium sp.]|nr:ABC transporter permease [Lentimicrobium sp.]
MFRIKSVPEGSLTSKAISALLRNKTAVASLWGVVIATIIAILGYLITPDSTPYANEQHIEIAAKRPGYKITMLRIRNNDIQVRQSFLTTLFYGRRSDFTYLPIGKYQFKEGRIIAYLPEESAAEAEVGYSFPLADVIYALPDTNLIHSSRSLVTIEGEKITLSREQMIQKIEDDHIVNRRYLLGTDRFGRDVLSQLMIGTRVSLSVGFISVLISLIFGILLGSLAGFFRGWVDDIIVWFINVIWSIPTLLLVIAITFALGKGFWQVFIAVGLTMWVEVARIVRGQIISIREKEFVEAARALGFKNLRIITRHILPNTMGPVIVISAANFASAILIEAGLSFLGIGVQPPMPSWGTMVKENYAYIILDNPWLALSPGIAIMLLVLAFMLIGNGLRDALDVKTNTVF